MRRRCCGNASIRSSPDTKTPTTPIVCATIPCCRSSPIRTLGEPLGSQPTLSRWENAPSARDLVRLNDRLCWSSSSASAATKSASAARSCSISIPPTIPPTASSNSASSTGLRPAHVSPHADLRAPHRMSAGGAPAPGERLQSCPHRAYAVAAGAAFAGRFSRACRSNCAAMPVSLSPLLYQFCEFFRHRVRHRHPRQLRLPTARPTAAETVTAALSPHPTPAAQLLQLPPPRPQLAAPAPHLLQGRTHRRRNQSALRDYQLPRPCRSQVFAFYNDRGECENRIEEFKNGFRADRLSCHRFLANAFRLLLHAPPTTWSTSFACSCRSLGAPPRSKLCAPSSSKSAPAYARPPAASAFTSPAAGPFNSLPSRLVLQLFLDCLGRSTTHFGKGQAELSQKTVRGIKERHDRPTETSRTVRDSLCCVTKNPSALRFQLLMN